ncbi:MAG: hypothetical protein K2X10_09490 [Hyphomicrobiales bacterium]|nr:hypothetical protein [Hyphomicrobiales bacterium]OQW85038.1 MAG: hypothetical protein BVN31_00840 [Proteobacteria bacterium ST_bin15]
MTKSMRSGCIAAGLILLMADASLAQTAASDDKGLRKQNIGTKVARPKAPDAERRSRLALDVRSPTFVIEPEYGRYGYLGDGLDTGRERAIYHSR